MRASEQLDAKAIYEQLAIRDVQLAADVLVGRAPRDRTGATGSSRSRSRPTSRTTPRGRSPTARRYWQRLDRPNVMIKIPGTPEGVPAIEQAIYEGINVNVTLLFAVSAYEAVAEAYIRGLERRHAEGKSLDVNSVASFFVSRVDTNVDRKLEELGRSDLLGTAAVANARAAYRRFKEIFSGPRWETLQPAGAAVQRPLWASTGTKNPNYPDTQVRRRAGRARTPSTRCRWRRCSRSPTMARSAGRPPSRTRRLTLEALADAGHRYEPGHRRAAGRGRRAVRGGDEPAAGRDRRAARGGRHRPAADDRRRPPERASGAGRRARQARGRGDTSPSACGGATPRCGAGRAFPRSRIGSAG